MWQPWTQNLYTYVGNNPVNFVDPTGHRAVATNEGSCNGCGVKVLFDKVDMQGNHWYTYTDGSTGVQCWNGDTKTPCPDRNARENYVAPGYQCVVTGQGCSSGAPPVDFAFVSLNLPVGSVTVTADKNGTVYVSFAPGISVTPVSISAGMGWVVADTGASLSDTLSGPGYQTCGTVDLIMTCAAQSSNGSIMVMVGIETAEYDVSATAGNTWILNPKKKDE